MHETLIKIKESLEAVINEIDHEMSDAEESFSVASNNGLFPGLTKAELIEEAQEIIVLIEERGDKGLGDNEAQLSDYISRLKLLQERTVPDLKARADAVVAYMFTLQGLKKALKPALTRDLPTETSQKLHNLAKHVRSMESRYRELDPRIDKIPTMLDRIEKAYNAAYQLPTDLEDLKEAKLKIAEIAQQSSSDGDEIARFRVQADEITEQLGKSSDQATDVLEKCRTADSAATSVGLAKVFSERSKTLSTSMWMWVAGLIIALGAGSYFSSIQFQTLAESFKDPNIQIPLVVFNYALSLLTVGAPIWFAWLATKQIGQRFKLSEDYAFKASVFRAYEAFRCEAARFGKKDMEAQLLASTLSRFDELPLRLVETESHGSPWQEMASSNIIKKALKTVPGFAGQVIKLASDAISSLTPSKRKSASKSTSKSESTEGE